jgi:hypothetical protein
MTFRRNLNDLWDDSVNPGTVRWLHGPAAPFCRWVVGFGVDFSTANDTCRQKPC